MLEPLAAELGARALAVDLVEPGRDRAHGPRGRRGRHPGRQRRAAGVGALESFTIEEIDRALNVNLRAPIVLAHALSPQMVERGRGHLLFMSSQAGKAATPGTSLYTASKFGLRGFAASLRADLHGTGVGVSTVFPGFIRDAGMFAEAEVKLPPGVGTRTPEDVADAVVKAIEHNRGEIDVAPLPFRASTSSRASRPSSRRASRAGSAARRSRARWPRASARSAERLSS